MSVTLTLYTRHGCHLCEAFRDELNASMALWEFKLREIDVDSTAVLAEKYGVLVPVLVAGDEVLCQHFFDPDRLKTYFGQS